MADETPVVTMEINALGAYVKVTGPADDRDWVAAQVRELWQEGRVGERAGAAVGFTTQVAGTPPRDWKRPAAGPIRGEVDERP